MVQLIAVIALAFCHRAAAQPEAARKALESAAAKGNVPAQYALGAAAEANGDFPEAVLWYRRAAENGYAAAQFKLGLFLESGNGVQPDTSEALTWLRKAAEQGFQPAVNRLISDLTPPTVDNPTAETSVTPKSTVEQESSSTPPSTNALHPAAATAGLQTVVPSTETDANGIQSTTTLERVALFVLVPYVLLSTWCGWQLLGRRLRFGTVLPIFISGVVGCLGGNIYYILASRRKTSEGDATSGDTFDQQQNDDRPTQSVVVMEIRKQSSDSSVSEPQPIGNGRWVISWSKGASHGTKEIRRSTMACSVPGADLRFKWTDIKS